MTARHLMLTGSNSCVVIELDPSGVPLWRHWGAALPEAALPGHSLLAERTVPSFHMDALPAMPVFAFGGGGWFGQPCLQAHRAGRDFVQQPGTVKVRQSGTALSFEFEDSVAGIRITVSVALDPETDVLSLRATLTNTRDSDLTIDWFAPATLPLPATTDTVRSWSGRHNGEWRQDDARLGAFQWRRENRRGLTSHATPPFALAGSGPLHRDSGEAFGATLAWSGNHVQIIEPVGDGRFQWQFGQAFAPGELILAPNASHTTPEVLACYSPDGLNGLADAFQVQARARISWPGGTMKPRPVHLNTWEGVYFDLDEARLMDMATAAAELGIERFVLDDGWFGARRHDRAGLGDWFASPDIFPVGLGPLARHVTGLGMEFGLWFEPEMVNPDSDLYRAHPDWVLQLDGRPLLTARNQLVLDLSRNEVRDHLLGQISALLGSVPVSYIKWDHNRDLAFAGSDGRAAFTGQIEGAYALFDAVREAFPEVEIEACAGGGGRVDFGILPFVHRFWTSDNLDAVERLRMHQAFLQWLPPEVMGAHVGASPAHGTGRAQSIHFRCAVAMSGHFGVELDPTGLDDRDRERLKRWIGFYKHWRGVLHAGPVRVLDAPEGVAALLHGGPDRMILAIHRVTPLAGETPAPLRLRGLDAGTSYRLTDITPNDPRPLPQPSLFEAMRRGDVTVHVAWLATHGLALPPMLAETSRFILIELVGGPVSNA